MRARGGGPAAPQAERGQKGSPFGRAISTPDRGIPRAARGERLGMISRMPALRFLCLLTLAVALPSGLFLWHRQLARLEREAVRVLEGPRFALAAGTTATWRLDLDADTEDEAWMDAQRQPRLSVRSPGGVGDVSLRARARYVASGDWPEVSALMLGESWVLGEPRGDEVGFGPLWLSYLQPLEIELEVLGAPAASEGGGAEPAAREAVPILSGSVDPGYAFARSVDRKLFVAFAALGALGLALLGAVELAGRRSGR